MPHPTFKLAGEKGWGVISMSAGPKATLSCWETYRDALAKSSNREVELGEGVGVCTSFYVGGNNAGSYRYYSAGY